MVEHKLVKQQRERNKQKAQAVKDLRKLKSEEAKLDAEMAKLTGVNEEDYPNYMYVEPQETSPKATETIITSPQWNTKKYHLIRYQKPSFGLKQMTWVVII